jgi:hypothetical protein
MMSDEIDLLAANTAFYAAFAGGDYPSMEALWAKKALVCCVHPGWPPVDGRENVLRTWRGILGNPPRPPIRPSRESARIVNGVGVVVCFEAIGDAYLVATNLFIREHDRWKMIHHQAGAARNAPGGAREPDPTHRLH